MSAPRTRADRLERDAAMIRQQMDAAVWVSPRWFSMAACAGTPDVDLFFPADEDYRQARVVCRRCPVMDRCLQDRMVVERTEVRYGMWGGMTPDERRRMAAKAPNWRQPVKVP